jgi:hypothetical protein
VPSDKSLHKVSRARTHTACTRTCTDRPRNTHPGTGMHNFLPQKTLHHCMTVSYTLISNNLHPHQLSNLHPNNKHTCTNVTMSDACTPDTHA